MLILAALFMGTGFGFTIPLSNHEMVDRSPVAQRGRNLAALSMAIFAGQFLSTFVTAIGLSYSATLILAALLAIVGLCAHRLLSARSQKRAMPAQQAL